MSKSIIFSNDARQKLAQGVDALANAVTSTLGPSGRNVIIEQAQGNPVSTKDGVTVAKSIELTDPQENIGAQIVKQASIKTAEQAGDGTTTSTLLAQTILNDGMSRMHDGANAVDIKKGISKAVNVVTDYLIENSKDITDEALIKQVATISSNNDEEVGTLIATAIDKVGRDGVVTIEESRTGETYLETVEGMQFDRGYKSPYFVTDNNTMTAVLDEPLILITDKRLTNIKELLPILEGVSQQNKSLVIIADDIDGEALSTMVVNKMRGILPVVAVKARDFGDRKKAILQDIATLTGGQVVSSEKGQRLDKFDTKWLGTAHKVTVGKDNTTIIDAKGNEEDIQKRMEEIKNAIDKSTSPYEKENLQSRLAKFIGGIAIVYVGGHTEVEMKEKKDRVDDALHATQAALEEGILPGGGVALLKASKQLVDILTDDDSEYNLHEKAGVEIVIAACESPFTKILTNGGLEENKIGDIEEELITNGDFWYGYNSRTDTFYNMDDITGIIDPTKVTRLALENAASVASTMLITEAVVSINKEDDNKGNVGGVDPNMLLG